jgi:hypothetical protein
MTPVAVSAQRWGALLYQWGSGACKASNYHRGYRKTVNSGCKREGSCFDSSYKRLKDRCLYAAKSIIRFLTFSDFGLTHTCCRFEWRIVGPVADQTRVYIHDFDPEETEEIHDEEREYLQDFEAFLEELQVEYTELGFSVMGVYREALVRSHEEVSLFPE